MLDRVEQITIEQAKDIVRKYHYSKVFPRINKYAIGGYLNNELVAVMLLGFGTRPMHTIQKIFPTLDTSLYLELGKLCVSDECPRNTESYFISKCIQLIKREMPHLKVLFSWADGIVGKVGYVYQGSNFAYGGSIVTEMYLDPNGNRVHPRSMQGISTGERVGKMKSRAYDVTVSMGFQKYFGYQFRYVYPLCSSREWKKLLATSPYEWTYGNYPKDNDLKWWKQISKGKRIECGKPPFTMTEYVKEQPKKNTLNLFFDKG